ncbi:annulin-like [Uloborus diversus]|uniref:annulin-like n=1 Tax=Uloborus diversus TaxID=327109 RepID=UPI00240970CC|nr:annulin-like [Uloborus diversus]
MYSVTSSPFSHVGEWLLQVDTSLLNNKIAALNFKQQKPISILFNPWNNEDTVFLNDELLRQEYVMKDEGVLFIGTTEQIDKLPWTFGQFNPGILECCWLALTVGDIRSHERNDPVKVVRLLSAAANSNDDEGVLLGRWDGEYKDGIAPTAWVGSAKIVQQYVESAKPVKYGQCWVFSGLLTASVYRMGPCSVVAVKRGEVQRPYDTPFVLGEVNADYVTWLSRGEDQPIKALEWDKKYVGQFISTLKPGSYDREDVTDAYKAKEDTIEERSIMDWAWSNLGDVFPRFSRNNDRAGVDFELDAPKNVTIGEDIMIRLRVINNSTQQQLSVLAALTLDAVSYTDSKLGTIKQEKYQKKVGRNEHFDLVVPYHEYLNQIKEQGYLRASVLASAPEMDYDEFLKNTFRVTAPPIGFSVTGSHRVGEELLVNTQFVNPLDGSLSKAYMILTGSGIGEGQKKIFNKGALPKETLSHTFTVIPQRSGNIFLNAKFWAPEMHFSEGYHVVAIQ